MNPIQREFMAKNTPVAKEDLPGLAEADRFAAERKIYDDRIKIQKDELNKNQTEIMNSFVKGTPMSEADIKRQQKSDNRINSREAKLAPLTIRDLELGGSKRKSRKPRKMTSKKRKPRKPRKIQSKKSKKRKSRKMKGGNNIGANCSDPNFSIYNTNLLKLFPYKGGSDKPPGFDSPTVQISEEEQTRRTLEEQTRLEEERRRREEEARRNIYEAETIVPDDDEERSVHYFSDNEFGNEFDIDNENNSGGMKKRKSKKRKNKKQLTKKRNKKGGEFTSENPYSESPQF
jgi:hypothetical protein